MRNIRRKILYDARGNTNALKAVAFAIYLKQASGNSSVFRKFTFSRLHRLTGMHISTLRKWVNRIIGMGLAHFENECLYIEKMASSSKHRNVDIGKFQMDSARDIYKQLRSLMVMLMQARKDFVKSILQQRRNPKNGTEMKSVSRACRKYSRYNEYRERGTSYKRIASELGCCVATAVKVVAFTIGKKWLKKKRHFEVIDIPGLNYRTTDFFTYSSYGCAIVVKANTYELGWGWKRKLVNGMV